MAQAIAEAIGQEMERDPKVFAMGEDIGRYGSVFSAAGGLLDRFELERIIDTPISESAFIGAATGAAAEGMRPVAELMFVDFFGVCMDQIYNHLAKNTYMSGGAPAAAGPFCTSAWDRGSTTAARSSHGPESTAGPSLGRTRTGSMESVHSRGATIDH